MLFPRHEWHPTLAGKNTSSEPFEIESLSYKPRVTFLSSRRCNNVLDCSYYCRPIFSWRNYKKNKPLIAARIAEEKEKDRLKDLRRDTRRRQWALALADILARRNGLPIKGVELVFKLDDDKRRYLAQQVKRAGLERKPRRRGVTPQG